MTLIVSTPDQIVFDKTTESFAVSPEQADEIVRVANTLVVGDIQSAHTFGRQNKSESNYLEGLLKNITVVNQGEMGSKLTKVASISREISASVRPSKVQQFLNKIPIVGHVASRALQLKTAALSRYHNVESLMNDLNESVSLISEGLTKSNLNLEKIYQDIIRDVHQAGVNIVASFYAIKHVEHELERIRRELKENPKNNLLALEVSNVDHQLSILKKRRKDMIMGQQKNMIDLQMVRMKQQNNLGILDQLHTIDEITLPAAMRGQVLTDEAEKSNSSSRFTKAVGDLVNEQARHQADLVRESSVRVRQQSYRPIYEESTIDYMNKQISAAIDEIKIIDKSNENQLQHLEQRSLEWMEERRRMALESNKH